MDIKSAIAELETKQPLPSPNGSVSDIFFGVPELDTIVGKLPRGKIIEIYGSEASGKTTLLFNLIKNIQDNCLCAYIDTEHSFDIDYAKKCGVNTDSLLISNAYELNEVFTIIEQLINKVDIIFIDSLAGIYSELDCKEYNKKLLTYLRKIQNNYTTIVFTNQIRDNFNYYQKSIQRPNKKQIEIYSSIILELDRISRVKKLTKVKTIKNKYNKPNQEVIIKL